MDFTADFEPIARNGNAYVFQDSQKDEGPKAPSNVNGKQNQEEITKHGVSGSALERKRSLVMWLKTVAQLQGTASNVPPLQIMMET